MTSFARMSVSPTLSVTVSRTTKVPVAEKVWVVDGPAVDVPPSPKLQLYPVIVRPFPGSDPLASNRTLSLVSGAAGENPNSAVGPPLAMVTVVEIVPLRSALSVTRSMTTYVPSDPAEEHRFAHDRGLWRDRDHRRWHRAAPDLDRPRDSSYPTERVPDRQGDDQGPWLAVEVRRFGSAPRAAVAEVPGVACDDAARVADAVRCR